MRIARTGVLVVVDVTSVNVDITHRHGCRSLPFVKSPHQFILFSDPVYRFDIYRKVPKDLTQPTVTGAIVSITCIVFITFLLLSEFYSFISTQV